MAEMIRKQIYIPKRQDILIKRLSKARGVSESEIIRQAIESEISGRSSSPQQFGQSAWREILDFIENRKFTAPKGKSYRWERSEIYADRESRLLNRLGIRDNDASDHD